MKLEGATLVVVTVAVVLAFTAVLLLYSKRRTAKTWKGSVVKVRTYQMQKHQDEPLKDYTDVHFRTEAGRRVRLKMEKAQYDATCPGGLQTGDRVEKVGGEWWPKKLGG